MILKNRCGRRLRLSVTALGAALALLPSSGAAQEAADAQPSSPQTAAPPAGSVGGLGDINLFPKRLVLEGRREVAVVGLFNKTANEGDYEIAIHDMAMVDGGQLVPFDNLSDEAGKAEVKTASAMLRHSPRRVTLRGSESQTIRLMVRAPADLPPGEYRSHFQVVSVPRDVEAGVSIEDALGENAASGIGVTIRPRFGISIPVIVRIGETTLDVGIRDASILTAADGSQAVSFTLTRSGTRSAYGDVIVTASGRKEPIALARGVGLYPELDNRQVVLPLNTETGAPLSASTALTISFVDDDVTPGVVLATHSINSR